MSGGQSGAQAGTLTFMVGASAEHFEVLKPVLAQMGRGNDRPIYTGRPASASTATGLMRKHLQEFIDFANSANRAPIGFYQAYPGLAVTDIKALLADSRPASA